MDHSGKFVLRIPPKAHKSLAQEALKKGLSLNALCSKILMNNLHKKDEQTKKFEFLSPLVKQVRTHFSKDVIGILLFGSRITGKATDQSDLDCLIVLSQYCPLRRSLYSWWDENILNPDGWVVNPQFVHLPASPEKAGGLWFEVVSASEILWEENQKITRFLQEARGCIEEDRIRRCWTNGQPYWVWRDLAQQGSGL